MNNDLICAYKYWRQTRAGKVTASQALSLARNDVASNVRRYPSAGFGALGAADENGLRWCENPAAFGLRFVGFADEICRHIDHTGWFTDTDTLEEVYRGAVYQLPARNGRPIYLFGYREGFEHRRYGWQDTSGVESAHIDFAHLIYGDDGEDEDAKMAAARYADGMAESAAESAREYNEAYAKGSEYADLADTVKIERQLALELIREIKATGQPFGSAVCKALRAAVESHVDAWREAKEKRAELLNEWTGYEPGHWRYRLEEAFRDGAGLPAA